MTRGNDLVETKDALLHTRNLMDSAYVEHIVERKTKPKDYS